MKEFNTRGIPGLRMVELDNVRCVLDVGIARVYPLTEKNKIDWENEFSLFDEELCTQEWLDSLTTEDLQFVNKCKDNYLTY